MDIQNHSSISFRANVSQKVLDKLKTQLEHCPSRKKSTALVQKQIENLKSWGSEDSSIVIAKDFEGSYLLGVQCSVAPDVKLSWGIRNMKARTELSQFLSLNKARVEQTEQSIKYLYNRYGIELFEKHQDC